MHLFRAIPRRVVAQSNSILRCTKRCLRFGRPNAGLGAPAAFRPPRATRRASSGSGGNSADDTELMGYGIAGLVVLGGLADWWRTRPVEPATETVKELRGTKEVEQIAQAEEIEEAEDVVVTNWSNTHAVSLPAAAYHTPATLAELEALVAAHHESGAPLRPVGSALSPNGLGLSSQGMVNLALMDDLVSYDPETGLATIQAGARIERVVELLRAHGRTIPTFASIREQQLAGFIQASAHGTGLAIPPADGLVEKVKVVTPALGTLELSSTDPDPTLFNLARCGLGAFGVLAEITLRTIPAHKLVERTFLSTPSEIAEKHRDWVKGHRHVRYMWIPHTEAAVVVWSDPEGTCEAEESFAWAAELEEQKNGKTEDLTEPYLDIYTERGLEPAQAATPTQLRDKLYESDPLNPSLVARVNAASAEFWKRNQGVRVDWSDKILGFDCGGEQWVDESCFKVPGLVTDAESTESPPIQTTADIQHTLNILSLIKRDAIPAHEPIEQRWTSSTASPLSPAYSKSPEAFSWVGIIMYLKPASEEGAQSERDKVTAAFHEYARKVYAETDPAGSQGIATHLAKMECDDNFGKWREGFRKRMGEEEWRKVSEWKRKVDPKGVLDNRISRGLFRDD